VEPMPEDWDRAVAVVAHPDDLEYGTAAAVARWTGQGRQVSYVRATRGEAGIAGMPPERAGPLREQEERSSAAAVGVTQVEFLGLADGVVEYGDAANGWVFREAGPPWTGIRDIYVAATGAPTHFVDITATMDAGVASLREHQTYIDGLGGDFDAGKFLRTSAESTGRIVGCTYAVSFRRHPAG
jgi:LmbE family N-acetylglucosaminyl deacetylase